MTGAGRLPDRGAEQLSEQGGEAIAEHRLGDAGKAAEAWRLRGIPGRDHQHHPKPRNHLDRACGQLATIHVREADIGQEAVHAVRV
jgi:hypothetical protein